MEYSPGNSAHTVTWMNLEDILLREIRSSQKDSVNLNAQGI